MDKLLMHVLGFKPLDKLITKLIGHYVTIFMIHRSVAKDGSFQGVSPAQLEQCLIYAKNNNYHFASLDEVVHNAINNIEPDRPTLCFTLDDGFDDQVQELVPILLKYGAKPTIFVLSDFVDGIDWPWDSKIIYLIMNCKAKPTQLTFNNVTFDIDLSTIKAKNTSRRLLVKYAKTLPKKELAEFILHISHELKTPIPETAPELYKSANWDQLRHFESLGLTIGSHACSHHIFNSLSLGEVRSELNHAKSRLDAEIKSPSRIFCYPSGTAQDYSPQHADLVKELGYIAAVSANPNNTTNNLIKQDLYNIHRHGFPLSFTRFVRYISWFEAIRSRVG